MNTKEALEWFDKIAAKKIEAYGPRDPDLYDTASAAAWLAQAQSALESVPGQPRDP